MGVEFCGGQFKEMDEADSIEQCGKHLAYWSAHCKSQILLLFIHIIILNITVMRWNCHNMYPDGVIGKLCLEILHLFYMYASLFHIDYF